MQQIADNAQRLAEEHAQQQERVRQMIADSQRGVQAYFDGQRDHQAQSYRLNSQQLDNLASNTELGKKPAQLMVRGEAPPDDISRALVVDDARKSHVPFDRPTPRASAARQPGAQPRTPARDMPTQYLNGVPIRPPRRDADGNVRTRYGGKPMTEWREIDQQCRSPFLASYGITEDNWEACRSKPCPICNVYGEADHTLGHCLFVFSCTGRGREYFGAAKAAERAQATRGGARSVRELVGHVQQQITASDGMTQAAHTASAMCHICELAGVSEDDDAAELTDLCASMDAFTETLRAAGVDTDA